MHRSRAVFCVVFFAGCVLSGSGYAGNDPEAKTIGRKPDVANAKPAGWAADRETWEKRAEERRAQHKFVKDTQGRQHYIVALDPGAAALRDHDTPPEDGFAPWHKPGTRHLVQDLKRDYHFRPTSITSLTGPRFLAYLDADQVAALRADSRVVSITEDEEGEFSAAVWANAPVGNETKPWGVQAVGGGNYPSYGGVTVYVLDSGVNAHPDLNLVEQIAAQPGVNPIGCYGHATHVAGIIGAKSGNTGVVGVFPNVRIVSIALSTVNDGPGGCSDGETNGTIILGMEQIKQRIQAAGRVGIINISSNAAYFQSTDVVNAIQSALLPADGYPGAVLVQSAGNQFSGACNLVYNGAGAVIVVGAIDDHGQRVVPLNGLNGFKSMPYASDELGSNFGSCVSAWAPGSQIYSTWTGGSYVNLSGTSMAAPHVTGIAALVAENTGSNSPDDIRAVVLGTLVPIQGANVSITNINYQGAVGIPEVQFAESAGNSAKQPVGSFTQWQTDNPIYLQYDSVGAANCNLTGYMNGSFWYNVPNFVTSYNWGASTLIPAQYQWNLDCVSSAGAHGTAQANGWIKRQVTQAYWLVATASTGYSWVSSGSGSTLAGPYRWTSTGPLYQQIVSQNADYCQVRSYGWTASPSWNRYLLWDSGPNFPANYTFQPFYLGNPQTAAPPLGPYDGYLWELTCTNSDGGRLGSTMWGGMQ